MLVSVLILILLKFVNMKLPQKLIGLSVYQASLGAGILLADFCDTLGFDLNAYK